MSRTAVSTVRKLLRVAKRGRGNEAAVARQRAREIMARHKISVNEDDGDEETCEVPSAARDFWREQLLIAVAEAHACRVAHSSTKRVLIVGDRADVTAALRAYRRATHELRAKCALSLLDRGITALRRRAPVVHKRAVAVYTRVFCCTAVTEMQHAIASATKAPENPLPTAPASAPTTPVGDDVVEDEVDLLMDDLNDLAALVGMKQALVLKATAESDGAAGGRGIVVREHSQALLAAQSEAFQ